MKTIQLLMLVLFTSSCSTAQSNMDELNFLLGTWKMEDKEQFETWQTGEGNSLKGYAHRLENGQMIKLEALSIVSQNGQITYQATVPSQNDGKTIPFVLDISDPNWYSFENNTHDFPKKIRYRKVSEKKIEVQVLGDNDEGFSYFMDRQ